MPIPLIAAMSMGSSLLGGVLGNRAAAGQAQRDRDFQGDEAAKNRQWQRQEAGTQMQFQERMRSTEWQTAVKDMEAAGINPALAYGQGGASSPGGAMGGGAQGSGSRANQSDVITPAVSSALQYMRANAEIKKIEAETQQIRGRVGRAFEPAVDAARGAAEGIFQGNVFSKRNARILSYEFGSSARSLTEGIRRFVQDLKSKVNISGDYYRGAPRR